MPAFWYSGTEPDSEIQLKTAPRANSGVAAAASRRRSMLNRRATSIAAIAASTPSGFVRSSVAMSALHSSMAAALSSPDAASSLLSPRRAEGACRGAVRGSHGSPTLKRSSSSSPIRLARLFAVCSTPLSIGPSSATWLSVSDKGRREENGARTIPSSGAPAKRSLSPSATPRSCHARSPKQRSRHWERYLNTSLPPRRASASVNCFSSNPS